MSRETMTHFRVYKRERAELEKIIPTVGLLEATRRVNELIAVHVDIAPVPLPESIKKFLTSGQGILAANHWGVEDPRVLMESMAQILREAGIVRNDIYFVSSQENKKLYGPNTQELMILTNTDNQETHKIGTKLKYLFKRRKKLTDQDVAPDNTKTGMDVLRIILRGGIVVMFPEGEQGKGSDWLGGVGGIIPMLDRFAKSRDIRYVTAFIQGTGLFDGRIYVPVLNKITPHLRAKVTYLESLPLAQALQIATTPAHAALYKPGQKEHDHLAIELQQHYEEQIRPILSGSQFSSG